MNASKYFRHVCFVCALLLVPTVAFTQDRTPLEKLVNHFPLELAKRARTIPAATVVGVDSRDWPD